MVKTSAGSSPAACAVGDVSPAFTGARATRSRAHAVDGPFARLCEGAALWTDDTLTDVQPLVDVGWGAKARALTS